MKIIKKRRTETDLRRAITDIIAKSLGNVVSVASVILSNDTKQAEIRLFPIEGQVFKMEDLEYIVRKNLSKKIALRRMPKLRFCITAELFDDTAPESGLLYSD